MTAPERYGVEVRGYVDRRAAVLAADRLVGEDSLRSSLLRVALLDGGFVTLFRSPEEARAFAERMTRLGFTATFRPSKWPLE